MPNTSSNYPAEKLLQLATGLLHAQRFAEAEARFREVLAHDSGNVFALHRLSLLAWDRGQRAEAKQLMQRALQTEPENRDLLVALGQMLHETSEPREALDLFLRVLALNSSEAEVWNAAGICLQEISQPASAIEFYLRAIALQPQFAEAHNNLGVVLTREGEYEAAIEHFERSLELDPASADCHSNLAVAYRHSFRYAESIASFREALRLRPDYPEYVGALGEALSLVYDPQAESTLRRALELAPGDPNKHWNLALELLKHGKYTEGLREFEWRQRRGEAGGRAFDCPLWSGEGASDRAGESLHTASILLHAEQGFGDTIQFLRYLPEIAARAGHVFVEVQPELYRLTLEYAQQVGKSVTVLTRGEALPSTDWQTPLMSLAFACGSTLATIPPPRRLSAQPRPLLQVAQEKQPMQDAPAIPASTGRTAIPRSLRIGLAWAGNPHHGRDRERSLPFDCLAPLFDVAGCTWVSLQTGPAAQRQITCPAFAGGASVQVSAPATMEQPALRDFLDTAEILDGLDLVLCPDTAVAHLAATQGVPTWILLPYVGDWRWFRPPAQAGLAASGAWYPQARIFRQAALPDGRRQADLWEPVIAEVSAALTALVATG